MGVSVLPEDHFAALGRLSADDALELMCKANLGVWTARRRGLEMSALHWEWCDLRMRRNRLAVVAPREHSKSETFTVNGTAWECLYKPGIWTYVFASTGDQATEMLSRIKIAVLECAPWMNPVRDTSMEVVFRNGSRVNVAGGGKGVRGAHPDVIIGDDVLEEGSSMTAFQRRKMERWWFGTVGGMAHPGTLRTIGQKKVWMPPTRVFLVGTPFHERDLLMNMRENPMYEYRRYAAEFDDRDLVDGLAVEIG